MRRYRSTSYDHSDVTPGTRRAEALSDKPVVALVSGLSDPQDSAQDLLQWAAQGVEAAGGMSKNFQILNVDGSGPYGLAAREVIADTVEIAVNDSMADGLICLTDGDIATTAMLMAAMRLNIPTLFVAGVMVNEAGGAFDGFMNYLLEAAGLALPGGSTLANDHSGYQTIARNTGQQSLRLIKRYYDHADDGATPCAIATKPAFENMAALAVAMGAPTDTVLHLCAAAHAGGVDFHLADIARLARTVPLMCEAGTMGSRQLHRAGGIMAMMGELARGDMLSLEEPTSYTGTLEEAIAAFDVTSNPDPQLHAYYKGEQTSVQSSDAPEGLDLDRVAGAIRSYDHATASQGALAVLYGSLAPEGCVVTPVSGRENGQVFQGPARVFDAQELAVAAIRAGRIQHGDVVVIRYEGPRGGPGMANMAAAAGALHVAGLSDSCALVTDGRVSRCAPDLSVGHVCPEAAAGGLIALVEDGDEISVDLSTHQLALMVEDAVLDDRWAKMQDKGAEGYRPQNSSPRPMSSVLKAYALQTTSASEGAVRRPPGK